MKTVILSGGSGNTALLNCLIDNFNDDIKIIVNAYDSGKSTGICRKVTNTLGVSDIRKNHFKLYKFIHKNNLDKNLITFYESRIDLEKDNELECVSNFLIDLELAYLIPYAEDFFKRKKANEYTYNDFSVANIIYSEMYADLGYEETNRFFSKLLNIPDCVILNSYDNTYIKATTKNDNIIEDEGDIVEYKNADDKIVNITYNTKNKTLNRNAIKEILTADNLIISTGTFWSSIYPTLHYNKLYKYINESNANKIWFMNTEQDKDSYGVSSNMFIYYLEKLGLNVHDFTIVENLDGDDILKELNNNYKIKYEHLDNINGKNDSKKLVKVLNDILI